VNLKLEVSFVTIEVVVPRRASFFRNSIIGEVVTVGVPKNKLVASGFKLSEEHIMLSLPWCQ
jgi:hypothetical protein